MTSNQSVIGFNNCGCRDHAAIFGDGAFYDLYTTGVQANQATNLPVGQECVVATKLPNHQVAFKWYSFLRETLMRDDTGTVCRVFFGDFLMSATFSKGQAAREKLYSVFFDVKGRFKRQSTIPFDVPQEHRPTRRRRTVSFLPEEIDPSTGPFFEGATRQITVNAYERNDQARAKCIEHYGAMCAICDMSFADVYGPVANGFIHVHHLKPLSEVDQEYEVDPVGDLRPVCPNCHAVIHLGTVTRSIAEVRMLLHRSSQDTRQNRATKH